MFTILIVVYRIRRKSMNCRNRFSVCFKWINFIYSIILCSFVLAHFVRCTNDSAQAPETSIILPGFCVLTDPWRMGLLLREVAIVSLIIINFLTEKFLPANQRACCYTFLGLLPFVLFWTFSLTFNILLWSNRVLIARNHRIPWVILYGLDFVFVSQSVITITRQLKDTLIETLSYSRQQQQTDVELGAVPRYIQALECIAIPETEESTTNNNNNKNNRTECSICFESFTILQTDIEKDNKELDQQNPIIVYELLQCQHRFHEPCLRRWLAKSYTCPLCRNKCVFKESEMNHYHRLPSPRNSEPNNNRLGSNSNNFILI